MSEPGNDKQQRPDQPEGTNFFEELQKLGKQFEQTFRSAFESEQARSMQRTMSEGMQTFLNQMQQAAQSFQQNSRVQHWSEQGQQAVNQARDSQVIKDFQETLTRGMVYFNQQLEAFAARTRKSDPTASPQEDTAPTGETPPDAATGPTVKLDPETVDDVTADEGPTTSPQGAFFEQLRQLGERMEQIGRGVIEKERSQAIREDINTRMQAFFGQMQQAAKTVQEDPRVQDWSERGQQAVNQTREKVGHNQAVKDFQETLARGVAYFNQQLNEFAERMRSQQSASDSTQSGSQNVPIDFEDEERGDPDTSSDPGSQPKP